jgi:hypothetical protein
VRFKIKKNLCRVPDHGHSAKNTYIAPGIFFLSHSLSHSLTRRRRCPPRRRAAAAAPSPAAPSSAAPSPTAPNATTPSPVAPLGHRAPALGRRAPSTSPRLNRRCPYAAGVLDRRALGHSPRRQSARGRPPTPAPRHLTHDPPSRLRPNLQGDCLLPFCDIVIKKLLCSMCMIYMK